MITNDHEWWLMSIMLWSNTRIDHLWCKPSAQVCFDAVISTELGHCLHTTRPRIMFFCCSFSLGGAPSPTIQNEWCHYLLHKHGVRFRVPAWVHSSVLHEVTTNNSLKLIMTKIPFQPICFHASTRKPLVNCDISPTWNLRARNWDRSIIQSPLVQSAATCCHPAPEPSRQRHSGCLCNRDAKHRLRPLGTSWARSNLKWSRNELNSLSSLSWYLSKSSQLKTCESCSNQLYFLLSICTHPVAKKFPSLMNRWLLTKAMALLIHSLMVVNDD